MFRLIRRVAIATTAVLITTAPVVAQQTKSILRTETQLTKTTATPRTEPKELSGNSIQYSHFDNDDFGLAYGEPVIDTLTSASIHELIGRDGEVSVRYLQVKGSSIANLIRIQETPDGDGGSFLSVVFARTVKDFDPPIDFTDHNVNEIDFVVVYGMAGDDTIQNNTFVPSFIYGGLGDDTIHGGLGSDTIYGQDGIDRLIGRDGDDRLYGNSDIDWLAGGNGADILDGGDGADNLAGGDAPDPVDPNNPTAAEIAVTDDGYSDLLTGGQGGDRFWLVEESDDVVTDLSPEDDVN